MPTIKIKSIDLHYERVGKGAPLLFLHALGSCATDWIYQTLDFVESFDVITPDLPGHGESHCPLDALTIQNSSDAIAAMLESLHIRHAHIVGLSYGSFVALQLALDHPEKVASLTLASSSCCVKDVGAWLIALRAIAIDLFPMPLIGAFIANLSFPKKEQRAFYEIAATHIGSMQKAVYKKLFSEIAAFDVQDKISKIACPVLIVAGGKDRILPLAHAQKLKTLIPNAQLAIIQEAGHVIPIDNQKEFNDLLKNFICGGDFRE